MTNAGLRIVEGPAGLRDPDRCRRVDPIWMASSVGDVDAWIFRALNGAGTNPILDAVMIVLTELGAVYVVVLFAIPLWWRGRREATFDFLVLLGVAVVVTEVLKFAVDRSRPCAVPSFARTIPGWGCDVEVDPSFPSGHASRAFALATFVGLRFRWKAGGGAIVFAALDGLSRIYLGVHWPSDVLAGAVLGIGLALVMELVCRRSTRYQRIRSRIVEAVPHTRRGA
jgi:undecaprenyl-diphosphatase